MNKQKTHRAQQLILKADRLNKQLYSRMGDKLRMHRSQHMVLMYISRSDLSVSQKEIADAFEISPPAVAMLMKRLEKNGHIVRESSREDNRCNVITLTEKGYGKRNDFDTYNARNRGTKGVICQKTSEKTGALAGIAAVGENDDIMIITNDGTMIRTPVSGIPVYEGNNTSGVIIMRLSGDAKIISFTAVKSDEEEEAEIEALAAEHKNEPVTVESFPIADEDEI